MATTFIEPCGDTDFGTGLFTIGGGAPAVATDFVHGSHVKSMKFRPNNGDFLRAVGVVADAGQRSSLYIYINALPTSTASLIGISQTGGGTIVGRIRITSGGILQLWNDTVQIGSNGATLSTGVWYRICFASTVTSSTVNQFRVFLDTVQTISVSNATLGATTGVDLFFGNGSGDLTLDLRASDLYVDNSSALTDTRDIWVTAKRPNANGTTNGFTTQIGAGGSGYGSGHSPQVNERPNSDSNGWSIITVASAITEEYNIELDSVGDIDISAGTIIDYMGWVRTKALNAETAQIILNTVSSNISVTTSISFFTKIGGSSNYPAGTGADIGIISAAIATTISLYECGVIVAFIPGIQRKFGIKPINPVIDWNNPLTKGLVFDAPFFERGGSTTMDLANRRVGTIASSGATWDKNLVGADLDFSAAASVVSFVPLANANSLVVYSIEVLFNNRTGGATSKGRILDKGSGETFFLYHPVANTQLSFVSTFTTSNGNWDFSILNNTWNHVVITYDNRNVANAAIAYLNGIVKSFSSSNAPVGTPATDDANLYIGNRGSGDRNFDGKIAYARVWNRILNAQEVKQLYNNPFQIYKNPEMSSPNKYNVFE